MLRLRLGVISWVLACCALSLWACPLRAQDVRDVVREHVANELEPTDKDKDKDKDKPKPADEKKPHKQPSAAEKPKPKPKPEDKIEPGDELFTLSTDAPAVQEGPTLPQRVFGKDFKLDITLGGGYRGWVPQQYETVDVDAGSYYVWTIDVKAKIFRFLNLRRGYYESNGLAGPRTDEAAVAATVGSYVPKAAWLLGVIGFPISKMWEPIIRYESRSFHTVAHPKSPVCVVTDEVASDLSTCVRSREPLAMTSGFETFVLGVRYDKSKDGGSAVVATRKEKMPPLTFGIGLMSYRKPYQVTVDGNTLNEYLFDGRFRGAGLVFGTNVGGGPDRLFVDVDSQFGLGEVKLTDGLTLNSLAPEDWLIGYIQGNVTVGYHWPLWRSAPTLMLVPTATGGGASFFFFKAKQDKNEMADSAAVNWDFLWSVHAALVLTL